MTHSESNTSVLRAHPCDESETMMLIRSSLANADSGSRVNPLTEIAVAERSESSYGSIDIRVWSCFLPKDMPRPISERFAAHYILDGDKPN